LLRVRRTFWLVLAAIALSALPMTMSRRKTNRDWSSITEADWHRIEEELEEPEDKEAREKARERMERKKQMGGIDVDKLNAAKTQEERNKILHKAAEAHKTPGKGEAMGYVFITVNFDGCCPSDRKKVKELGRKWSSLLSSGGMDQGYNVWADDRLGFQTTHENHVKEITDFMMMQPEVALVRHDMENTYGPAATPEWIQTYEKAVAEREKAKEEKIQLNKKIREMEKKAKERKERKQQKKEERQQRGKAKLEAKAPDSDGKAQSEDEQNDAGVKKEEL